MRKIKEWLSRSSRTDTTRTNVDEVTLKLITFIDIHPDVIDSRYNCNPLTSTPTATAPSVTQGNINANSSGITHTPSATTHTHTHTHACNPRPVARSIINTEEMYNRPDLFNNMWRIWENRPSSAPDDQGGSECRMYPMNEGDRDVNRLSGYAYPLAENGSEILLDPRKKYEGLTRTPLSLRCISTKTKTRDHWRCKADLINDAFDFAHPDTKVIRSVNEYGTSTLMFDVSRQAEIESVMIENVLDDRSRIDLEKLRKKGDYVFDRITWTGNGWEENGDGCNPNDKVQEGVVVSPPGLVVRADCILRRA
ncbi:uncharacterized protein I303_100426 [Kwoniella dejecticola CBS 10117]|uniref:Uncharacterized protein n=1 Tax=Kwoniella dejecticola CBS 10117 TaxID=1296121 RepID=A0A1A6AF04_9TREE|nr:uncharacterized protein I303_00425 [Kwoniella dejecticola CBS 10117]OBR88608.1 hypothetical protein I303_00425 [Kwoniella dejecticola CBS 10117]